MKTAGRIGKWKRDGLPFQFDATRRSGLSDQLAEGLRQAILTGRYAPGTRLPTNLEWAKMLGVSIRVPEAAIARLVSEGLIVARRRIGCVVAERGNKPNWKGHVLVVVPDGDACYYSAVQLGCVRANLSSEGYLVTSMTVLHGDGDSNRFKYDLAPLEFALRQSVDLVVLIFNYKRPSIARAVSRSGVPFAGHPNFKPVKPCVSAAHLYGKRRVDCEAFTSMDLTWDENFRALKEQAVRHFARGVTHLVFHTYTHNPQTDVQSSRSKQRLLRAAGRHVICGGLGP